MSALWAAVGVGLGALVRNQVFAIVGLFAWVFVVEILALPVPAGRGPVRTRRRGHRDDRRHRRRLLGTPALRAGRRRGARRLCSRVRAGGRARDEPARRHLGGRRAQRIEHQRIRCCTPHDCGWFPRQIAGGRQTASAWGSRPAFAAFWPPARSSCANRRATRPQGTSRWGVPPAPQR